MQNHILVHQWLFVCRICCGFDCFPCVGVQVGLPRIHRARQQWSSQRLTLTQIYMLNIQYTILRDGCIRFKIASSASPPNMQLTARLGSGERIPLNADSLTDITVLQLKMLISSSSPPSNRLAPDAMRLVVRGRILKDDDMTLQFYNIQEHDTIHVARVTSPPQHTPTVEPPLSSSTRH